MRLTAWRAVEAQHQVSTRKLVDSLEEQAVLEQLIEAAKPPRVVGRGQHVLLATPFRYPPLPHGSRFGTRRERSLWYGAEDRRPLLAEVAYYRFVFLEGTQADLDPLTSWHTAFTIHVGTDRGIDLAAPPFERHRARIASPVEYADAQALGSAMRAAGVEAFRYPSARDVLGGVNVGIFAPEAFGSAKPRGFETWHCTASRRRIEIVRRDFFDAVSFVFPREDFLVDGRLPSPAV